MLQFEYTYPRDAENSKVSSYTERQGNIVIVKEILKSCVVHISILEQLYWQKNQLCNKMANWVDSKMELACLHVQCFLEEDKLKLMQNRHDSEIDKNGICKKNYE